MANRRMFSKTIIDSDDFLDMPVSARLLYYDLGMRADDDGFVNPKRVMRITGVAGDDLKILLSKKYVLNFENKVLVIRDWKINNWIRAERHTPTIYQEYLKKLKTSDVKRYVLTSGDDDVRQVVRQKGRQGVTPSIGKVSIGKVSINKKQSKIAEIEKVFEIFYKTINPTISYGNKTNREAVSFLIKKFGLEKTIRLTKYSCSVQSEKYAPVITTPYQLKKKLAELRIYTDRQKDNKIQSL